MCVRDVFQGSDKKDIFGKMTFYNDSSRRDESENFSGTRGNMGPFCAKQLLVCKFELDAVGFFKTKFTGE